MDQLFARIIVEARDDSIRLRHRDGDTDLSGITCEFDCSVGRGPRRTITPSRFEISDEGPGITLRTLIEKPARMVVVWRLTEHDAGIALRLTVANISDSTVRLHRIVPLACDLFSGGRLRMGTPAHWSFFRMGWQSWSATRAYRVSETVPRPVAPFLREMEENPDNPAAKRSGRFISEQMALLTDVPTLQTLCLGFLEARRGFGDIRLFVDEAGTHFSRLAAVYHTDGVDCAPSESITSEPLWLTISREPDMAARRWAELTGKAMKARVGRHAPVGWCSWYHYYTRVTEADVDRNLRHLVEFRSWLPVNLVQLDDGYQREVGDWLETNTKFPDGVAPLMKRIDAEGFEPGLWTAPFVARPGSALARRHRAWFLKDKFGRRRSAGWNPVWGGRVYAIDPTHPDVRAWLRETYRTMRKEWGVRFFKLDFLYAAALPARRYDPKATRAQALRIGLETIREAVGDDAFILGCGCPLGPAVGLVDAMRIGCDVTPKWENRWLSRLLRDENLLSTKHALRNVLTRSFLHNALWINDPDCLMIRRRDSRLTEAEVRAMASVYAVSGGMIMISDDMSMLDPDRVELASAAIELRTPGCRVPELMASSFPDTAVAELPFGWVILAANWHDHPIAKRVNLSAFIPPHELDVVSSAREVWTKVDYPIEDNSIDLGVLHPHETRMLIIESLMI